VGFAGGAGEGGECGRDGDGFGFFTGETEDVADGGSLGSKSSGISAGKDLEGVSGLREQIAATRRRGGEDEHGEIISEGMERILPAQAGEAGEIVISGSQFGVVFHGERGEVGIGGEIAGRSCCVQESTQDADVLWAGMGNGH